MKQIQKALTPTNWIYAAWAEVSRQRQSANAKTANPQWWLTVGQIELMALSQIEDVLSEFSPLDDADRAADALNEFAAQWLSRLDDPHGYAQGTVWAVLKTVKPNLGERRSSDPPGVTFARSLHVCHRKPWYRFW